MILTMNGKSVKNLRQKKKKELEFTAGIDKINKIMEQFTDEFFIHFVKEGKMFSLSNFSEANLNLMLTQLQDMQARKQIREIMDEIEFETLLEDYDLNFEDLQEMGIILKYVDDDCEDNDGDSSDGEDD